MTLTTSVVRARLSTTNLTDLIEATVDLHAHDLADRLRTAHDAYPGPSTGHDLTAHLRKSRWDAGSSLAD
ncbi:hypothetical protein [Streptomyces sp. NPDC001435]|uniref:hypothetical protein n=1 Tax=Streptomyces sp. NPDC001435 TaxID=3364576 RepID=UPI0036CD4762